MSLQILTSDPAVVHTILCTDCDTTFIVAAHITVTPDTLPFEELHSCNP